MASQSIFDQGSGLNKFLDSGIGQKLTNVFENVVTNAASGLVKTKSNVSTINGQQIAPPVVNQNNPNAGGLLNSLGFGTVNGQPNYLVIGIVVLVIGLIAFLIFKK